MISDSTAVSARQRTLGTDALIRGLERWVVAQLGSVEHERRVRDIALNLFDLTWQRHRLSGWARRVLEIAAILHDIGRGRDKKEHPALGARMVMGRSTLALTAPQRRAVACLTHHHRGGVPDEGEERWLNGGDDRRTIRALLALLRAADALDSRTLDSPRLVICRLADRIQVDCYIEKATPKARKTFRRRKKFRMLEDLLDLRIEVALRDGDALRLVA